jgi:hypothetical protein
MKCCVGVMTYEPVRQLRLELLEETLQSIETAFPGALLCVIDNGSEDGTDAALLDRVIRTRWNTRIYRRSDTEGWPTDNFTPGMGRNRLMGFMDNVCCDAWGVNYCSELHGETFFVWSDDDMLWKPGAEEKLAAFWGAPREERDDVVLLSGFLEPVWHWNTPRRVVEAGGVRVLVRDSCPGAAWGFENPRMVWPMGEDVAQFGYDYKTCCRLRKAGCSVAQLDLADHLGWECSSHGNEAIADSKPLDREKWGV